MTFRSWQACGLGLLLIATTGCLQVYGSSPATSAEGAEARAEKSNGDGAQGEKDEKEKDEGPFKPWDEVLKDTEAAEGLFKTHLKRDQSLLVELAHDQLDRDFGLVLHYSRGIGDFNIHDGLRLSAAELVRFRRVGDKIYLVNRNPRFTADAGSPMRASVEENVGHSILAAFDIKSEHEESENLLIDVTSFLVSDYADIGRGLKFYHGDKPVSFDGGRSFVSQRQSFPKNLEIDVELTFSAGDFPTIGGPGVSDFRSIPVGVRYSFFALPEEPMQPRLADDRLGYFLNAVQDFSRDDEDTSFVRMVRRWRLEKKDPSAELSEPVKPITFYIDHTVPHEYRTFVREGIEGWNKAYEKAGFLNAVVALDAPDDPAWSAEDMRYSTVRWTAAHNMGYAIGPSQSDPRTGEQLNADILISSIFVRGWLFNYQQLADPNAMVRQYQEAERLYRSLRPDQAAELCLAQVGRLHQLAAQQTLLAGLGVLDAAEPMPKEFLGDALRDLVLHEVGHTLGLRHNFKSSSGVPNDRLHDTGFTRDNGVTVSVMDYAPVNIAVDPSKQGHYFNKEVGSYDQWVIQYGYAPVYKQDASGPFAMSGELVTDPREEVEALSKIARRAADPLLTYGTDEDNWLGPFAIDPLTSAWDLGGDPVAFAVDRTRLVDRVTPNLERRLITDGKSYQRLRGALGNMAFVRWQAMNTAVRTVGGVYATRDHKGDPNGRLPLTPASAATQRRAVQVIVDGALASGAFSLPPELLNKMAPNRWAHWAMNSFEPPIDVAIHQQVLGLQTALLANLFHPARLARILDNEVRMLGGEATYPLSELFETVAGAIWSQAGKRPADVDSFQRNLQRAHLDLLISLLIEKTVAEQPVPADARSLARHHLSSLAERIDRSLSGRGSMNVVTRAHLAEARALIEQALNVSLIRSVG